LGHSGRPRRIGLGTMAGGWRIVKTMGQRITKLTRSRFAAETSGAITLFIASYFGIPVSTTHTIHGPSTGVGAANRISAWVGVVSALSGRGADDPGGGGNRRAHLPAAAGGRLIELQGHTAAPSSLRLRSARPHDRGLMPWRRRRAGGRPESGNVVAVDGPTSSSA